MEVLQPAGWPRPRGYANGVAAKGKLVFVAGQIGWNARQEFDTDDLADQVRQALANVVAVLAEAGAMPSHITRMTWYVRDMGEYRMELERVGVAYGDVIGRHYPAMTLVEARLLEDRARVEIEVTAVIPA